jgi:hypothetical protein
MQKIAALAAALTLAACGGDPAKQMAEATPAAGAQLEDYSRNITRAVQIGKDAPLVQRFCQNATKAPCPADIADKLKTYGFIENRDGVDLAHAYVAMLADEKDGAADQSSSDEDFWTVSYRAVLAREPDQDGGMSNLKYIKDTGERKSMLRSMLESQEFKNLK